MTATTARDGCCPSSATSRATWVRRVVNPASTRPDSLSLPLIRPSAIAAADAGTLTWSSRPNSPELKARERSRASPRTASSGSCDASCACTPGGRAAAARGAGRRGCRAADSLADTGVVDGNARERRGQRGPGEPPRGGKDSQEGQAHGHGPDAAAARPHRARRAGRAAGRAGRSQAGAEPCRKGAARRRPGGRSGARHGGPHRARPPDQRQRDSRQRATRCWQRGVRARPAEPARQGTESFDPALPRRAGQGCAGSAAAE